MLAIYAVSVGVVIAVSVALFLVHLLFFRTSMRSEAHGPARYFGAELEKELDDRPSLQAKVDRIHEHLGASVGVFALDGTLLAGSQGKGLTTPMPSSVRARLEHDRSLMLSNHPHFALTLPFSGPIRAYATVELPPPNFGARPAVAVALILILLAILAVVAARAIAGPLTTLAAAARDLGSGKLNTRVRFTRGDEFGEVGRAFDEMADRLTLLINAQNDLVRNVSHELRTPLARVRVALDLAAEGDASEAQRSFGAIADDLLELERMVEDLLTSAKLDLIANPAGTLRLVDTPLEGLLENSARRFSSAYPKHCFQFDMPAARIMLRVDATLLRRAVDNLLDNAGKYSEPESKVSLRVERHEGIVRLAVQDGGIGIAPGDLDKLGTPFFRTDKSRSRATGGAGLGLALVKRIVQAHGGKVLISSTENQGTTVELTIPVQNH